MPTSIVVGCGYVGSALAEKLVDKGHEVYAVSRTGVEIKGVESVEQDVTEEYSLDIPRLNYAFYLVSAGSRDPEAYKEAYIKGLKNTIGALDADELVYSSSTGVYEVEDGSWVDEETTVNPKSKRSEALYEAEQIALGSGGKVVRFAGLYGPGRYGIGRYTDGARVPKGYLNLLHREDGATALYHTATQGQHDLYVAVDDEPVDRHDLSRWLAEKTGREPGNLVQETRSNKRCSNKRLRNEGWSPEYPTFRQGYSEVVKN